jgi:putative transposase
MSRKRFTVERIIGMLGEAEVVLAQGKKVGEMCRSLGVPEQS